MDNEALDFSADDTQAGFRLHRFEVYNWGTFHQRVWHIGPHGASALLTGDIGSGKSTLVDAITTLLVPAQRITYNKAAGAESKERSLRSYVEGHYRAQREEGSDTARAIGLRDHNSYSVILGRFYHSGFDQSVTLAQVFWLKNQGQPDRFYVVADQALTIAEHFADFGADIAALKKRLRAMSGVKVHDTFPPYGHDFRRRFGIEHEQALELFNQTVSMKSVGNLTDFVRSHMLEAPEVDDRIAGLIGHFDDLNRAHDAVVDARARIEALEPLVADSERHSEIEAQVQHWRECRDHLEPWFAGLKAELLDQRIGNQERDLAQIDRRIERLSQRHRDELANRDELKRALAEHGGDRLESLARQIEEQQRQRDTCRDHAQRYNALARALELPEAADATTFTDNQTRLASLRETTRQRREALQGERAEAEIEFRQLRDQHGEIETELSSLRERRSNIPAAMLSLRQRLCEDLELAADELPFAGELIQVREDERDWEGAAERLLHNFGLSLLVPETHYRTVAEWVDRTHLRGRLVYYRVRQRDERRGDLHPDSLVRKLIVRPDSAFYDWLEAELAARFDYACCADLDQFRREQRAITRAGQIKAGGQRHEKDDRHRIDDRSRFILGWSNEDKIAALEKQSEDLQARIQAVAVRIAEHDDEAKRLGEITTALDKIEMFTSFEELDWQTPVARIAALEEEKQRIETESDTLRTLQAQLDELEATHAETEGELNSARDERSRLQERRERAIEAREEAHSIHARAEADVRNRLFPQIGALRDEALGQRQITVESCDNAQSDLRSWLQQHIDRQDKQLRTLQDRIISAMRDVQHRWPQETQEMDVSLAAAGEYAAMLANLKEDDLPRFEQRFRELLNEQTIREVANFHAHLQRERNAIGERLAVINRSLHGIDFNPGRYIELQPDATSDVEIRDFQRDLRACTEGTLAGGDDETQSMEARFRHVRQIIERLRGREGNTDADRRWRRKVTDVRNWFTFSAEEKWREDDTPYEHYTDSGGKSGGQKEKLAYTVLAASLAYQFGLEGDSRRSRSFRFVVIDEAFGRGSDESARFGLELFERLKLQLLIVTPLQKIHIIEPYVASVGFVHSPDGAQAQVQNLTIEEYRARRDRNTNGYGELAGLTAP
jgi:uncharacterized protein YPO0396